MSSLGTIYQVIDVLSKDKGIDAKVIREVVKDAMLVAARKHFHTTEDLVAEMDEATGALHIYGVKHVADPVVDADKEISLADARKLNPEAEIGTEIAFRRKPKCWAASQRRPPSR